MQVKIRWMLAVTLVSALSLTAGAQTSVRSERGAGKEEWFMNSMENGRGLQIRVKGKAEFNDDYSDIRRLSPGGSVRIRDSRGAQIRRLEIEADGNGNLKRVYFVNDSLRDFDAEARQWMTAMMLDLVRQSGFDAERRVARLFEQGGANAVLAEIGQIKGSYAKSLYFRHLLKQQTLDVATVQTVVRQISREITSAYEKRQALSAVSEKYLREPAVLGELIAAAGTIDSDYERGQLLAVFVQGATLTEAQLQATLRVIAGIGSDYEQAQALLRMAKSRKLPAAARPQLFDAIKGIDSDYEQARVLLVLLKDDGADAELMKLVVKSSADISSDYEQARVLLRVAALGKDNEDIRKMLVEAAKTIGSEYERGRVLSATFR